MKTKQISPLGLSVTGSGPKIFRTMLPFLMVGIILQILFPSFTPIPYSNLEALKNAGWIWLVPGIFFWVAAIIQFSIGFPKGKLITTGIYSLSRNPIYASWVIFILPGPAAICNNWFFLLAASAMYISLVITVKNEEKVLLETFGKQYQEYAKKVSRVLFFPSFE